MTCITHRQRSLIAILLACAAAASAVAQTAEQRFHQAYYLDRERGEFAAAADLYEAVARDNSAPADLRATARERLAACREELATIDFARLVPPNALAYVEINRPGAQLERLLRQIGLLRTGQIPTEQAGRALAISPLLVRELLDVRGAAVAVTGFDPSRQMPTGVAIIHPGNVELLRGVLETALPAAGTPVEPIDGHPTYETEPGVYITLTSRLAIVSLQLHEIEAVIDRLGDSDAESFATNPACAGALADRKDAMLFYCVNFEPVLPLVQAALAMGGSEDPRIALAQTLFDFKSLRTISGRVGVSDDGVFLDAQMHLAEGHHNLVFNFARLPSLDPDALRRIPAGAAGFMSLSLNPATDKRVKVAEDAGEELPPVSFMDIGREIFGNVVGIGMFVLPTTGDVVIDHERIPDFGIVITVNDAAKSRALWTQMLGIASLASGGGLVAGGSSRVGDHVVHRYTLPEGASIYFASVGTNLLISPSKTAITASLETLDGGPCVMDDPAFSPSLARLNSDTMIAAFGHAGRCLEIAKALGDSRDLEEIAPFADLMTNMVGSFTLDHGANSWRLRAMVSGLPNVSGLVSDLLNQEFGNHRGRRHEFTRANPLSLPRAAASKVVAERVATAQTAMAETVWMKFKSLADDGEDASAADVGSRLGELVWDDARKLNNYAWAMLTDSELEGRFAAVALELSTRSNQLTAHDDWHYLDTLARAHSQLGEIDEAIRWQERALERCDDSSMQAVLEGSLKEYLKSRQQTAQAAPDKPARE